MGRTVARGKAALVIDWRRLRAEALAPLLAGRPARGHPFDFQAGHGLAAHTVTRDPARVIVLDGVYLARPELADLIDLAILVEAADDTVRRQRLLAREGASFMAAWHRRWDAAEDYYFTHVRPRSVVRSGNNVRMKYEGAIIMAWIYVRHRVQDYNKWKEVYEKTAGYKRHEGWKRYRVYQVAGDRQDLIVMEQFATLKQAAPHTSSQFLRDRLRAGGRRRAGRGFAA